MRHVLITMMMLAPLAGAPANVTNPSRTDDPSQKDTEKLQGTWRFDSSEIDGVVPSADEIKGNRLIIKGDTFTLKSAGEEIVGTFKLDATKTPKTIDATFNSGPQQGRIVLGIYELDDTTFKVCTADEDKPRPAEFTAEKGSGRVLQVLKKE